MIEDVMDTSTLAELRATELVLGAALRGGETMTTLVACGMTDADVDHATHKAIWRVAAKRHASRQTLDARQIEVALCDEGVPPAEAVEFMTAFIRDAEAECDPPDLPGRIEDLKRRVSLRRLRTLGAKIASDTTRDGATASGVAGAARVEIDRILRGVSVIRGVGAAELARLGQQRLRTDRTVPTCVPIGIPAIDDTVGGVPRGGVLVIAAQKKIGKTTIVKHVAVDCAQRGIKTVILTLEARDEEEIGDGLTEIVAGIKPPPHATAMNARDQGAYKAAEGRLATLPLMAELLSLATAEEMAGAIHAYVQQHGAELIIVDYIQRMSLSTKHQLMEANHAHVSTVCCEAVRLANSTSVKAGGRGCAAIFMSQMKSISDEERGRKSHRGPTDEHVPNTQQWARDAYMIAVFHRDKYAPDPRVRNLAKFDLVANRLGGEPATTFFSYDPATARMTACDESGQPIKRQPTTIDDIDDDGFGS